MRDAASSIKTWKQIEPGLDAAVAKLPSRDREAVMLRFFRQLSLKDVGAALGVSEDAAKVRVSRAIARLRHLLGAATPAAALSVMLADNALHAAPPGLADSTITLTSGSPVPTAVTTIAKGALTVMRYAQLKLAAAVVVALVVSGAAVGFVVRQLAGPAGQVVAPQAVKTLAGNPEQTAPAGRSTPASALRTLMQEILAGTDHGRGWIAESDLERDAGEAVSDMIYQAEQLRIAAQKQFNQSITVPLAVNLPRPQQLDGSAVRETFIDDDHAAVDAGAGTLKVVMMRIDDQWKLPVDGLASAAGFVDVQAMRDECQRLFEGFRSIKTDLENEQFQSSRELDEAIRELISRKP